MRTHTHTCAKAHLSPSSVSVQCKLLEHPKPPHPGYPLCSLICSWPPPTCWPFAKFNPTTSESGPRTAWIQANPKSVPPQTWLFNMNLDTTEPLSSMLMVDFDDACPTFLFLPAKHERTYDTHVAFCRCCRYCQTIEPFPSFHSISSRLLRGVAFAEEHECLGTCPCGPHH